MFLIPIMWQFSGFLARTPLLFSMAILKESQKQRALQCIIGYSKSPECIPRFPECVARRVVLILSKWRTGRPKSTRREEGCELAKMQKTRKKKLWERNIKTKASFFIEYSSAIPFYYLSESNKLHIPLHGV